MRNYKIVTSNKRLIQHIHVGHAGITRNGGAYVTGAHNIDLIDNIKWRWQNNQFNTNPRGYKNGFVERIMSDLGWSGGNPPTSWRRKDNETTFWRKFDENSVKKIKLSMNR